MPKHCFFLAFFLLICLCPSRVTFAKPPAKSYTNYRFFYTFQYDTKSVLRTEVDTYPSPEVGLRLALNGGEEIVVHGEPQNTYEPSTWIEMGMDVSEENRKEFLSLFFVYEVKACDEVPIGGYFNVYYKCADGLHAARKHHDEGYTYYVRYTCKDKPKHLALFKQILRTFKVLPVKP